MAIAGITVDLVERGAPEVIPQADWLDSGLDGVCKALSDKSIIGISPRPPFVLLQPRNYVGSYRSAGIRVSIRAKQPDLHEELISYLTSLTAKSVAATGGSVAGTHEVSVDPATALYHALGAAVLEGVPFSYEALTAVTARPRGRILARPTLRHLASRGIKHRVVARSSNRQVDSRLVAVVESAASVARAAGTTPQVSLGIQLYLRTLGASGIPHGTQYALKLADELIENYRSRPATLAMLLVCQSILEGVQAVWSVDDTLPDAENQFVDTDHLWELAVLKALKQASPSHLTVSFHPFASVDVKLFDADGPNIDPDICVMDGKTVLVVADAKNSLQYSFNAGDVYQVLAYTERLGARVGAIVYTSQNGSWWKDLGESPGGARIVALGIDAGDCVSSLQNAAAQVIESLTSSTL